MSTATIPPAAAAVNQAMYDYGRMPEDDGRVVGNGAGCSGSGSGDGSGSGETAPAPAEPCAATVHFVFSPLQSHVQTTSSMGILPKESIFFPQSSFGQVKHCPS